MTADRIDVHQHIVPRDYADWLRENGVVAPGGRDLPDWSPETALALMDRHSIATAILSLSTPGTHLGDDGPARVWARRVNDTGADLVREHPDRFGLFATVPLPDVEGSVREIAHAYDELNADGVVLLANSHGIYLGDPRLEPVMAELDQRAAVAFVHPSDLPGPEVAGIPPFAADFLLDTTRAATNLVLRGVPQRYPNIRFILSHAGGFVPYAAHRIAAAITAETGRNPLETLADLAGFYFDTALSASPAALPSLLAFAEPGHVLFGSDWPFAPDLAVGYFTGQLDAYPGLEDTGRAAINRGNALDLFPRLAKEYPHR
ncbi:amidohydrolase family protein [Nocardia kruczakiae]|uniref:amidohydrolase family protein n=1 Tax=Nocardia kruczakiae TaxID=261477 RepID=UPI0007A3D893|nr:amidohydrolase family protein [Nocardia kruczakiae]